MSQLKEIAQHIKNSGHNKVKLAVVDIDGILRGKVVSLDKFRSEERRVGKECRGRRHTRFSRDWSSDVCSSRSFVMLLGSYGLFVLVYKPKKSVKQPVT